MTLARLGGDTLTAWRIVKAEFSTSWDSGEGAFRFGGRWNSPGVRAIYCSLDASTAILEVAAHTGFALLDTAAHVLVGARIADPGDVYVVEAGEVPNPHWLHPCPASMGQQQFGDALLDQYRFVAFPSVISPYSWNLMFAPGRGGYDVVVQERFAMDTRFYPA